MLFRSCMQMVNNFPGKIAQALIEADSQCVLEGTHLATAVCTSSSSSALTAANVSYVTLSHPSFQGYIRIINWLWAYSNNNYYYLRLMMFAITLDKDSEITSYSVPNVIVQLESCANARIPPVRISVDYLSTTEHFMLQVRNYAFSRYVWVFNDVIT